MPIYEYSCPICGTIEVVQKASEKALATCPECSEKGKKSKVQRMISASSFHLKGSGWYKTDYSGKSPASSGPVKSKDSEAPAAAKEDATPKKEESGSTKGKLKASGGGCGSNCGCH